MGSESKNDLTTEELRKVCETYDELTKLRAENERLRDIEADAKIRLDDRQQRLDAAETEVRRLKRLVDCYGPHGPTTDLAPLLAENVRLREAAKDWSAAAYGVVTGDIDVGPRSTEAFKRLEDMARDALGEGT